MESVKSILLDIDNDCEIVIQDNSSDNSLGNQMSNLRDYRIKYFHTSTPLSFIDNFEEGLNNTKGKFFCLLGDDDCTTKDILEVVNWMDSNSIESVSSNRVTNFIWPNDDITQGLLTIPLYNGQKRLVDTNANLKSFLKNGLVNYQIFDLPRAYHGIILKSKMDEIKSIAGRYFGGLTPDIYSTIALSCVIKSHYIINFPFSIAGACPESATAKAPLGGHAGRIEDAPHLKNRGDYLWEKKVPKYYSVDTIWAETSIKAIKDLKLDTLLSNINYYKLYVYSYFHNRKFIKEIALDETLKMRRKLNTAKFIFFFNIMLALLGVFIRRVRYIFRNQVHQHSSFSDVFSLEEAKLILYKSLNK